MYHQVTLTGSLDVCATSLMGSEMYKLTESIAVQVMIMEEYYSTELFDNHQNITHTLTDFHKQIRHFMHEYMGHATMECFMFSISRDCVPGRTFKIVETPLLRDCNSFRSSGTSAMLKAKHMPQL